MHTPPTTPPASPEQLLSDISGQYEQLSRQLKRIARHIETNRESLGLLGIQDVAQACEVQPSAVVRFAKRFGFSGFSEMQRLFRDAMALHMAPWHNYQTRIRGVIDHDAPMGSGDIARTFLEGSIIGMERLRDMLDEPSLTRAVDLLFEADTIWLVGVRRSFSVVTYLNYALQHTSKRIQLINGLGSQQANQLRSLQPGDVMLAVSFMPYATETQEVVDQALQGGATLIAITDSRFNPLASRASATLTVQEAETFGFRALTSTLCLAQSLFIALAYRLELEY
ncbi:MurR/RpiR family transcriptional regulator [Castellaniella sp.]|uniref:MurR/RpiR family transcriptional regulator n=1 Tax=Castellaniella sp. TaxID=1955812 RepID=UPI002B001A0B|nr:MurR/RpiR family transcriptional regulator [Castellaniella sp.]